MDGIYREMIRRTEGTRTPDIPYANMLLRASLYVILDCLQNEVYEHETNDHGAQMQEIRNYIDTNYAGDISLESIADRFHLSVYYLARQFRKHTSYTINKYIIICRMGEAQRRLIHTEDRIDDIAVICGFTNLSYFYASFKKNVGCTPMEFRKAYKNETEEQIRVNRA